MTLSAISLPDTTSRTFRESRGANQTASQGDVGEAQFKRSEVQKCDLRDAAVQIIPPELVSRHSTGTHVLGTESIYAPAGCRIECRFKAPVHLLVMYDEGARREGETSVEGINSSALRNFAEKLTFVPAGRAFQEWHEISMPTCITYLYLEPAKFHSFGNASATTYEPSIFFEDSVLQKTAAKFKDAIERGPTPVTPYSQALANVLLHELPQSDRELARDFFPSKRGGMANREMPPVTTNAEEWVDRYRNQAKPHSEIYCRFVSLTPRQREVMGLVTGGLMNKQTAATIGISEMTVKIHRGRVMRKMGARSLAELVMMAESLGVRGKALCLNRATYT